MSVIFHGIWVDRRECEWHEQPWTSRCSASRRTWGCWARAQRRPMVGWVAPSPSPSVCACFRSACLARAVLVLVLAGHPKGEPRRLANDPPSRAFQSRRSLPTLACDAFSGMGSAFRADPGAMRCRSRVGVRSRTRSWFPCIVLACGLARAACPS